MTSCDSLVVVQIVEEVDEQQPQKSPPFTYSNSNFSGSFVLSSVRLLLSRYLWTCCSLSSGKRYWGKESEDTYRYFSDVGRVKLNSAI